jgi:hypothetical protein
MPIPVYDLKVKYGVDSLNSQLDSAISTTPASATPVIQSEVTEKQKNNDVMIEKELPKKIASNPKLSLLPPEMQSIVALNMIAKASAASEGATCEAQLDATFKGDDANIFDLSKFILENLTDAISSIMALLSFNPQKYLDLLGLSSILKMDPNACKNKNISNKERANIEARLDLPNGSLKHFDRGNNTLHNYGIKRVGIDYSVISAFSDPRFISNVKYNKARISPLDYEILDRLYHDFLSIGKRTNTPVRWLTVDMWNLFVASGFNVNIFIEPYKSYLILLMKYLGIFGKNYSQTITKLREVYDTNGHISGYAQLLKKINFHPKTKLIKTCPELGFKTDNYIDGDDCPIITTERESNLRRVHDELLIPILKYYQDNMKRKGTTLQGFPCSTVILRGLISPDFANKVKATDSSLHILGMAVDFIIFDISPYKIFNDITSGRIDIDYGVLSVHDGLHITLPYAIEGKIIRKLAIKTNPDGTIYDEFN